MRRTISSPWFPSSGPTLREPLQNGPQVQKPAKAHSRPTEAQHFRINKIHQNTPFSTISGLRLNKARIEPQRRGEEKGGGKFYMFSARSRTSPASHDRRISSSLPPSGYIELPDKPRMLVMRSAALGGQEKRHV